MQIKFLFCFLISFLIIVLTGAGCSMSPGARFIKKGEMEAGAEMSVYIGSLKSGVPVIPNLSFKAKYGINDRCNSGLNCNPFFLLANKTFYLAPYISGNLIRQYRYIPYISAYSEFSFLINFHRFDATAFPMVGVTSRYEIKKVSPYICIELAFDKAMFDRSIDLHWNSRGGFGYEINERWFFNFETGINNIGRRSYITNNEFGFPVIFAGFSYLFKKTGRNHEQ